MPRIPPPGGEVSWPPDEQTLGVVGLAPWATLQFCTAFYGLVRATKDWHYPRVLLDINTKIPSRGRALQLGETDPSPAIAATIRELAEQGATLAVVVCNTAHIFYDRWSVGAPIPILHIVDETIGLAIGKGARRIAPLVSESLAKHDLYGKKAEASGLACTRVAPEDQRVIGELIETVKVSGDIAPAIDQRVRALLGRLAAGDGVDTVVAGCTELSVLEDPCAAVGLRFVDSNVALARGALARLRVPEHALRG